MDMDYFAHRHFLFSFQSITYTLDTYRKVNEPMDKLSDYMLYICMFPQLIAGPIVRYCDVAAQINNRSHSSTEFLNGFYRFVIGLCKKILIADVIASYVDKVLGSSNFSVLSLEQIQSIGESIANLDSTTAWMVMLGYTMQLYFDFAGYSDMAIGLGRMMGFRFPENFDNPYVSTSISEFWRRWHQTLNVFIKNYLYIPLGGSHVKTESRKYFNLWVCFLVSGLWHGASWNFIVWGIIHGTFICLDKLFLWKVQKKTGKIPSMLSTFLIVMMAWMFFRIERIDFAWAFVKRLFAFDFNPISFADNAQVYVTLIVSVFFSFITLTKWGRNLQNLVYFTDFGKKQHLIAWVISIFALIFCVAALNSADFSPFIYFRF
jgi:Predicted membrane protein involved in D-alanine export